MMFFSTNRHFWILHTYLWSNHLKLFFLSSFYEFTRIIEFSSALIDLCIFETCFTSSLRVSFIVLFWKKNNKKIINFWYLLAVTDFNYDEMLFTVKLIAFYTDRYQMTMYNKNCTLDAWRKKNVYLLNHSIWMAWKSIYSFHQHTY